MPDLRPITPAKWSTTPRNGSYDAEGFPVQPPPEPAPWAGSNKKDDWAAFISEGRRRYDDPVPPCGKCDTEDCTCFYSDGGAYREDVLRQWGIQPTRVNILARSFYGAIALGMRYPEKVAVKDAIVKNIADQVYRALILACVGESRYDIKLALSGLWAARVKKRGSRVVNSRIYNHPMVKVFELWPSGTASYREQIADPVIRTIDIFAAENVRFIRNVFLWAGRFAHGTSSSYGGLMWASCAQLGLDWRTGKLSDVEFVDRVFDARHNGAPVLTKVFSSYLSTDTLFLTARSEASLDWLIRWTPNKIRAQFGLPHVVPLAPSMFALEHSDDGGESLGVIPDDKGSDWAFTQFKETKSRYLGLRDFQSDTRALVKTMVKKIRKNERFMLYGHPCQCKHGCRGAASRPLMFEHDCNTVCAAEGCECYRRLKYASYQEMASKGYDDEDAYDDEACKYCGSPNHSEYDCEYCENCEGHGHSAEFCLEEEGHTTCPHCGYKSDCVSCKESHIEEAHGKVVVG